jgi:RNA polymerase sigma-70 factor (ECF subfamily)
MISLTYADNSGALRGGLEGFVAELAPRIAEVRRRLLAKQVLGWRILARPEGAFGGDTGHVAASHHAEAAPRSRSAAGAPADSKASHARFQQDIVPLLDAAYNFARFLSRDADAAQDIVQDAFLRAYRGFAGYQGGDTRAWIFAIVRNCYHDWLISRRRKARLEVEVRGKDDVDGDRVDEVASEEDDPETSLLRRTEADAVRDALNRLPRPLREILILREIEGLSYRQIAEVAALPIGTVMSRLARARHCFAGIWQREARGEETTP